MTGTEEDRRHEACSAKTIAAQREVGNASRPITRVLSRSGPGSSSYRILALERTLESHCIQPSHFMMKRLKPEVM